MDAGTFIGETYTLVGLNPISTVILLLVIFTVPNAIFEMFCCSIFKDEHLILSVTYNVPFISTPVDVFTI